MSKVFNWREEELMHSQIVSWLSERRDNCLRIAESKTRADRDGWLDDARHFQLAIGAIEDLENRLMEAPPDLCSFCLADARDCTCKH